MKCRRLSDFRGRPVYGRALALDPKCAAAHCNLGAALHALGEPDEAADGFRRALALKPDDVEALSNLGNALQELKQFDDAIACYPRALTLRPSIAAIYVNLGGALQLEEDRLVMGHSSPPWDVLRGFDVTLDCFPHNSGTTLFESLWFGVPFVALAGRPSVGRLGAAILAAAGHPEWIAASEAEYVEKAVALSADAPRLAEIKAALRDDVRASPLSDEIGFARAVEASYRAMWRPWCAGLPASDLTIAP